MASLAKRLSLLLASRDRGSVAAVLGDALRHAEKGEVEAICRAALATGHAAGVAAVLGHLERLGPRGPGLLAAPDGGPAVGALSAGIARVLREGNAPAVRGAVAVIRRRCDARLAGHLVTALRHADTAVAALAAEALLDLTVAVVGPRGRAVPDRTAVRRIDRAVTAAARDLRTHRQQPVVLAAALLSSRPGPELSALLSERGDPFGGTLRGVAACVAEPLVLRNLLRWIGSSALSRSAARWLHLVEGEEAVAEALRDAHLLLAPNRRAALRRANRPLRCVPPVEVAVRLPAAVQARLPVLVEHLGLSARARVEHLTTLTRLPSPIARMRAIASLLARQDAPAVTAIQECCDDPHPTVARLAAAELLRRTRGQALLESLERSRHGVVARRVTVLLAGTGAEGLIRRWGRLTAVQRHACAVSLLAARPEHLVATLGDLLARDHTEHGPRRDHRAPDGPDRVDLILLIRRLRLVPHLESPLLALAQDADPRIASAAVMALAAGRDPRCVAVLSNALGHSNGRVRANAVEALGRRRGEEAVEAVADLAASPHNRVRANAVRVLSCAEPIRAAPGLVAMLRDPGPLHRVSGIWLARVIRAGWARPDLARLAAADPATEIRVRAGAALRFLEAAPGLPLPARRAGATPAPPISPAAPGATAVAAQPRVSVRPLASTPARGGTHS